MARSAVKGYPRETAVVVGLISGSHVINHMYLVLFPPILGILAAEFDVSLAALGLAISVQAVVNMACQLPYGYLADAYDRTLTLGLCLGLGGLGTIALALAPSFAWLLAGQVLVGLGVAGHHPAHYPLLSDASSPENRGRVFSIHGFSGNIGFAAPAAVIVAITAIPGMSWRHAFGFMGVLGIAYAAVSVYVLLAHVPSDVRKPAVKETPDRPKLNLREQIRAEARSMANSPAVLSMGVLTMVAATVMWAVTTYLAVFLEEGYNLEPSLASLSLTAMFVVGAVFILVGGDLTDRFGAAKVIVGGYVFSGLFILFLASLVLPPLAAVGAGVLGGALCSFTLPARDKLTDLVSARADLGRNFAIITIGYMLSQTIAPPVFGALIDLASYQVAFAGMAAVAALTVAITLVIVRRWSDDFAVEPTGTESLGD